MWAKQHRKVYIYLTVLLFLLSGACYKEAMVSESMLPGRMERVISFDGVYAIADMTDRLLLYCLGRDTVSDYTPLVHFEAYETIYLDGRLLAHGTTNHLGQVIINHPYQVLAYHEDGIDTFRLFFTPFPIAHVLTEESIRNEPKVLSWLALQYADPEGLQEGTSLYESFAGIEIRGHSTSNYDKKQYRKSHPNNLHHKSLP